MITFEQARRIVESTIPGGGTTEQYGYETAENWFPVIAPERIGGRVPGVSKKSGSITWMSGSTGEYLTALPYGPRP